MPLQWRLFAFVHVTADLPCHLHLCDNPKMKQYKLQTLDTLLSLIYAQVVYLIQTPRAAKILHLIFANLKTVFMLSTSLKTCCFELKYKISRLEINKCVSTRPQSYSLSKGHGLFYVGSIV